MAAYCRVYDSRHLQADCQEPGSAPEPYARYSSMGCLYVCAPVDKVSRVAGRCVCMYSMHGAWCMQLAGSLADVLGALCGQRTHGCSARHQPAHYTAPRRGGLSVCLSVCLSLPALLSGFTVPLKL